MKTFLALCIILLPFSACSLFSSDAGEDSGKSQQTAFEKVTISTGEQLSMLSGTANLHFVEVREDSRCPVDLNCDWEGQVVIVLALTANGQDQGTVTLSGYVGPDGYRDAQEKRITAELGGYRFLLERVSPYPTGIGLPATTHTAVLEMTKL